MTERASRGEYTAQDAHELILYLRENPTLSKAVAVMV